MSNYLLYEYFLKRNKIKLKKNIIKKRNNVRNDSKKKSNFHFDIYKDKVIKRLFDMMQLNKVRKKKTKVKIHFLTKFIKKTLKTAIRNKRLLMFPELLYLFKKEKSWKFKRSKLKNRRKLRHVKLLTVRRALLKREIYDLKSHLDKKYFWLTIALRSKIVTAVKYYRLKATRNRFENYFRLKSKFLKRKSYVWKKRRKFFPYFLKNRNYFLKNTVSIFLNFYIKLFRFFVLMNRNIIFFKFYFFRYMNNFMYLFRKSFVNYKLRVGLNASFFEFLSFQKKKIFRLRKRTKRRLKYIFNFKKYESKAYKIKLRMVDTNFFITLTDSNDKVIVSKSTGQVSGSRKKKVKMSPYLATRMTYGILKKLKKLKVKYLFFMVNSKINRHMHNVMKVLKRFRYAKILKVIFSKPIPHHFGLRKPKLKRL